MEYIPYSTATQSETAVSKGVELNCNIKGGGASDAGAVGGGGGLYSTVTQSETAVSKGVELNCNIKGGGASDAGAVGRGALGTYSPKSVVG